ncbi:carbonic anhydrase family protein [Francisella sp. Scap27]|uniref:carbonic anhydrase n=1 Tax=Francisella sp. Scap27 TaxID=2589986 RepID=UPI0015C15350|nr:carbonic anhydrase family protein [Francisella sp. Scap27]QLE78247.1 carbonic anhydrase family protein [Francisella sp. Scap27]
MKFKYKKIFKKTFIASSLAVLAGCASNVDSTKHAEWGYVGAEGPEHWGELSSSYKQCDNGKQQSPINILTTTVAKTQNKAEKIRLDYHLHINSILNNGHTIQIQFKPGSYLDIGKEKYELKQMHFHAPSENFLDGKEFPFEAHFVNISKDGKIAVLALFYEYNKGKDSSFIKEIWQHIPKKVNTTNEFDFTVHHDDNPIPNGHHSFYEFTGSLTTPPCTEGVKWVVLKQKNYITKEQVKIFKDTLHFDNNRPLQKTDNRKILLEEE